MNRVSAAGGRQAARAQTPVDEQRGRGGVPGEAEPGRSETLVVPPRRQPDDEQAGIAARLQHAVLPGRGQHGLGRHAEHPLNRQRGVRQQPAGVAPALLRHRGGAGEAERDVRRRAASQAPSSTADQSSSAPPKGTSTGPVGVVSRGTSNATSHGASARRAVSCSSGTPSARSSSGASVSSEIDVELGGEPSQIVARRAST